MKIEELKISNKKNQANIETIETICKVPIILNGKIKAA